MIVTVVSIVGDKCDLGSDNNNSDNGNTDPAIVTVTFLVTPMTLTVTTVTLTVTEMTAIVTKVAKRTVITMT